MFNNFFKSASQAVSNLVGQTNEQNSVSTPQPDNEPRSSTQNPQNVVPAKSDQPGGDLLSSLIGVAKEVTRAIEKESHSTGDADTQSSIHDIGGFQDNLGGDVEEPVSKVDSKDGKVQVTTVSDIDITKGQEGPGTSGLNKVPVVSKEEIDNIMTGIGGLVGGLLGGRTTKKEQEPVAPGFEQNDEKPEIDDVEGEILMHKTNFFTTSNETDSESSSTPGLMATSHDSTTDDQAVIDETHSFAHAVVDKLYDTTVILSDAAVGGTKDAGIAIIETATDNVRKISHGGHVAVDAIRHFFDASEPKTEENTSKITAVPSVESEGERRSSVSSIHEELNAMSHFMEQQKEASASTNFHCVDMPSSSHSPDWHADRDNQAENAHQEATDNAFGNKFNTIIKH